MDAALSAKGIIFCQSAHKDKTLASYQGLTSHYWSKLVELLAEIATHLSAGMTSQD